MTDPTTPLVIPRVSWDAIRAEIHRTWIPLESPHHSIIGQTGSGKSYFATRGIMSLIQHDKVLIIDVKGDDPTLRGYGKAVKELPPKWQIEMTRRKRNRQPRELWYRLLITPDFDSGRAQVKEALSRVWKEGKWFVVIDETRYLTDRRLPSLNLGAYVERLWTFGRSREISVIAMTQAPKWVPSSFYDQPSFVWIGRINDEDAQKRLREIGGLQKAHLPVIYSIKKREFLLIAEGGDTLAITGV